MEAPSGTTAVVLVLFHPQFAVLQLTPDLQLPVSMIIYLSVCNHTVPASYIQTTILILYYKRVLFLLILELKSLFLPFLSTSKPSISFTQAPSCLLL